MPFAGTGGQSGRTQQGSLQRQHAQRLHLHCSRGVAYARGPLASRTMMPWAIFVDQWRWWFALAYWVWALVDMVFEISSGPSGLLKGRQLFGKRDVLTPWESSGAKGVPKSHIFETLASRSWFILGFMHTLKRFCHNWDSYIR